MQLFVLAALLLVSLTASAEVLRFARNENLPEQDVAEAIFLQAMRNLQVDVVVDALPPARANMLNLSGAVVGEVARIESYGEKNPSLIRVEPGHDYLMCGLCQKGPCHQARQRCGSGRVAGSPYPRGAAQRRYRQ